MKKASFSYWEQTTWFKNIDYIIIGSGITGISCALRLRERFPNASILILERGILPTGASTRNAGFACFGSLSEIISDLKTHTQEEFLELIKMRLKGLQLLRSRLGDESLEYKVYGGYEMFLNRNENMYQDCLEQLDTINKYLHPVFKENVFKAVKKPSDFKQIKEHLIFNSFEGQLNPGLMMQGLIQLALKKNIKIVNNQEVLEYTDLGNKAVVTTPDFEITCKHIFIATNGFSKKFKINNVQAARSQVLVTNPIANLKIKGTYHLDEGYVYFRNIGDRILLGGGRNADEKNEYTQELNTTSAIQSYLEELLRTVILPNKPYTIEKRWSGILGVGDQKKPIIKSLSHNVSCGVRLGGMGVAIGSLVGEELANLLE